MLAFGNGSPDIFTSLANISKDDTELMYTQLIGGATFVTSFIIGIIMIIRPCHIPARTYVRDVLFFLLAAIFIDNSTHDQGYTLVEGIITVSIYFLFLATVVIDHFYMKLQIKNIRRNTIIEKKIEVKEELLRKAESLESILDFQVKSRRDSTVVIDHHSMIIVPKTLTANPNENLMRKFWKSINPVCKESWIKGNILEKLFMIL